MMTYKNLCDALRDRESDIITWLTKQPAVKEESLTDNYLYMLSEECPNIYYTIFDRFEESINGADWEWWFVLSDTESFVCRVQAKKLNPKKDNYGSIAYTRRGKLQIERLIEDANQNRYAAFYVFYSNENTVTSKCGGKLPGAGIYLASANEIMEKLIDKGKTKLAPHDVLQYTNLVSCMFCCPITNNRYKKEGFRRYLRNYYPTLGSGPDDKENGFVRTSTPIIQLITNDKFEGWEAEYKNTFKGTSRLLVFDLRNVED